MIDPQLVEFAAVVRQAPGLGRTQLEAGLEAAEVVAHQAAMPAPSPGNPRKSRACWPARLSAKWNTTAFVWL